MTVLVVGLSHRSAPVGLLERTVVAVDDIPGFTAKVAAAEHVGEAVVLSTCNRVEAYAVVDRFHGGVAALSELLAERAGLPLEDLTPHLYVHYDDRAVQHLFSVVCGLDSMVVGEGQILGQVRLALRDAQDQGSTGKTLSGLFQEALRVGKRAHAETSIDRAGSALVTRALGVAVDVLGPLSDRRVLLVGAGAMSGLAAATLQRSGVTDLTVVNRTADRADRLAQRVGGRTRSFHELTAALADADLVVSCTGAVGHVVTPEMFAAAASERGTSIDRPQVLLDLALPRDVDPALGSVPGVTLVDLEALGALLADADSAADVAAVGAIVAEEVALHVAARAVDQVEPTVVALRRRAADVVAAELARLDSRVPDLDPAIRAEVVQAVHRTVDKLLHEPTVRIKELAADGDAMAYAEALHALFDLDLAAVESVERVDAVIVPTRDVSGGSGMTALRLGTRRSPLALAQSAVVAAALRAATGRAVELVEIVTEGDRNPGPLAALGGAGVFTSALRDALLTGDIDFAVHSYKDLPTAPESGLLVAAVPPREDPRDVLVSRDGLGLGELPAGSRVGTGSPRRAAQLRALGYGLDVVAIRGNVDTRLRKVADAEVDAIVLARAGLARLGRLDAVTEVLDPTQMLPAPGQGALAVECRSDRADVVDALATLDDAPSRVSVTAERALLAALEAGCSAPVGALADVSDADGPDAEVYLRAVVVAVDGSESVRLSATGAPHEAEAVGRRLAAALLAEGAEGLMGARVP